MDATINEKWPENVRLKMIEKSELYEPKKVYQFGYYDGYQESQSEIQRLKELIEKMWHHDIETGFDYIFDESTKKYWYEHFQQQNNL